MSIVDVAKLAGVSNSTVSRVMNNHPRVSHEAVRAVRAAMETLKYKPSDRRPGPKPRNRALESGDGATIGFIVIGGGPNGPTPSFGDLMRGVFNGAAKFNLKLVYHHVADFDNLPAALCDGSTDGLLVHGTPPVSLTEKLCHLPTVWLMGSRRRPEWGDHVLPDTYDIGSKAARYLVSRGHKHLAYLNLDADHWPFRVTSQSFAGVAALLGVSCDIAVRRSTDEELADWPRHAVKAADELVQKYLRLSPRPTGLHVADDMQLAVVQPALQRAGVKVGDGGVEIVGCNREHPYLIGLHPQPAEIDLRVEAIGMRGVERLLWRLQQRDASERIMTAVEPTLLSPEGEIIDSATLPA